MPVNGLSALTGIPRSIRMASLSAYACRYSRIQHAFFTASEHASYHSKEHQKSYMGDRQDGHEMTDMYHTPDGVILPLGQPSFALNINVCYKTCIQYTTRF